MYDWFYHRLLMLLHGCSGERHRSRILTADRSSRRDAKRFGCPCKSADLLLVGPHMQLSRAGIEGVGMTLGRFLACAYPLCS